MPHQKPLKNLDYIQELHAWRYQRAVEAMRTGGAKNLKKETEDYLTVLRRNRDWKFRMLQYNKYFRISLLCSKFQSYRNEREIDLTLPGLQPRLDSAKLLTDIFLGEFHKKIIRHAEQKTTRPIIKREMDNRNRLIVMKQV